MCLPYWTEDGTAKSGKAFEETKGELVFLNEETSKTIKVPILREDSYEKNVMFHFALGKHYHIAILYEQIKNKKTKIEL